MIWALLIVGIIVFWIVSAGIAQPLAYKYTNYDELDSSTVSALTGPFCLLYLLARGTTEYCIEAANQRKLAVKKEAELFEQEFDKFKQQALKELEKR